MQKSELRRIILSQQSFFQKHQDLIPRDLEMGSHLKGSEVVMICGIRGCGKTSLLKQIADRLDGIKIYINFEAIRSEAIEPEDFEPRNFQDIRDIASELVSEFHENSGKEVDEIETGGGGDKQVYYFLEEIQQIPLWEWWLDSLYEQGIKVFVTGSNSKFMSSGNGLFLSGRNRLLKLFPFSFKEYLRLKGIEILGESLNSLTPSEKDEIFSQFLKYFDDGGFPQVIKNDDFKLSREYFEEILQKEILDRHEIEDLEGLRRLAVFLFSNVASEYSFETLKKVSRIEREETVRNYLGYLEEAFLLYRVPMLNHSQDLANAQDVANAQSKADDKKESRISKESEMAASCKVYAGDTGFFKTVATNYPDSLGLRFENLVFLELLRRGKEVFYFKGVRECDFVFRAKRNAEISEKGIAGKEIPEKEIPEREITGEIQVSTYFATPRVKKREILGLLAAMEKYGLEEGLILTLADEDMLEIKGRDGKKKKILVKPVWMWLLEYPG